MCGRTIRVDHVKEYRRPKDDQGNEIIETGCGPKTPTPSPSPSLSPEPEIVKKKEKKKKVKKEKNKKHKKIKRREDSPPNGDKKRFRSRSPRGKDDHTFI